VGANEKGTITFTRSIDPESSSIFSEWVEGHRLADQVIVPTVDFAEALRELGRQVDLPKFDIEGAELDVLQTARPSDLAACRQLTVEFHDHGRPPITQSDIDRVCQLLRSEGYGLVNANWPYFNDVLFVNLRIMTPAKRIGFRCRVALANALFIARRLLFGKAAANLQTIGPDCSQ
jgi:Methyltransferase FkbM domain